ncbi:flagellar hook assembly protein FlgD [Vreelandella sp. EE27]
MNIDSSVINSINGGGRAANLSASQSQEMRDSFMTLLVTQLQNQDPLNPMENAEMTSQLAQINTVSGIEELNSTLKGITAQMDANQALQASGLIGKGVMVPGRQVLLEQASDGSTHATPFGIELDRPASNVKATIVGEGGQVIRQYDLGALKAGVQSFDWNGLNDQGVAAASGRYTVQLEALDSQGEPIDSSTLNYALVNRVTPNSDSGDVRLDLGAVYGQVTLGQVKQIL